MDKSRTWFAQVQLVAIAEAFFFQGSGTLADCPPFGTPSNEVVVRYQPPPTIPTAPTASLFPFAFKLETVSRNLPDLAEAMAAASQTNVAMFANHPYYKDIGDTGYDSFWNIHPIQTSSSDDCSYLSVPGVIRGLIKPKG